MSKFHITDRGYKLLCDEYDHLVHVERPNVIAAISEAREFGDLSENAEYHAAREKQGFIETRISELGDKIARAEIVDIAKMSGDVVKFGATVTIEDVDSNATSQYQIVSDYEADVQHSRISVVSPIARALIGKKTGDVAVVTTPAGNREYKIKTVEFN